jgi:hypothetical protein
MSDQDPKGEMPEAEAQAVDAKVESKNEDPFDKERAMDTINKLRDIEKQAKRDKAELERLQKAEEERKKAELSETDRLKAEIQERDAKLNQLTIKAQQREVADRVGLPAIFADRIQGETPEDMEADAKLLLEALPKGKSAPNSGATAPGENASVGETEAQRLKRLFG